MEKVSLQFQGVRSLDLLVTVLAAIGAVLIAQGAWHLIRRRRRAGLLCLAAAAPSAFGLALAGEIGMGLWMLVLGLQIVLAVGLFYAAVYAYLGTRRLAVLMVMRCAAILLLLLVLFKPAVSVVPGMESYRPRLGVLLDRSASMATTDQAGSANRYLQCLRGLQTQEERFAQSFRPVYYHFAKGLDAAASLEALGRFQPAGEGTDVTDIARAIGSCAGDYDKADLTGIVLLSDGIHNAPAGLEEALRSAGVPVYAVGVGSRTESQTGHKNLQIVAVEAPFDAIRNNASTIQVQVKATGLAGTPVEVQLLEDGNVVAAGTIRADVLPSGPPASGGGTGLKPVPTSAAGALPCELKWTPKDRGGAPATSRTGADIRHIEVFVPPVPGETLVQDNRADLHVLVTDPKIRLLYVEGTIRPEYKFLWRALNMDPQVQLMSLVRVERSKFSGFSSMQAAPLSDLPRTEADFRLFDVIILGDLDATFLSSDQMGRLKKFVEGGGGLLMLGGHNSFGPGGFAGTDVEAALPVFPGPRGQPQETTPFLPLLTAEGRRHPILDGVADYLAGPGATKPKPGLARLPDLLGCVAVVGAKPGASVLAVHPTKSNEGGPLIVLAVQSFGAGRSAAFTADTTWEWFMPLQGLGEESPYRLFWGQMVRWLANAQAKSRSGSASLVLRLGASCVRVGTDLKVTARVLDEKGKAAATATVTCTVEPAVEPAVAGTAAPPPIHLLSKSGGGLFEETWRPAKDGKYVLRATAVDPDGAALASDELPLTVTAASTELDVLARNEALLRTIADSTGGRYADVSALPEIVDQIVARQKILAPPDPKPRIHPSYDSHLPFSLFFLGFVALLTGEWLLRRNWQLQ